MYDGVVISPEKTISHIVSFEIPQLYFNQNNAVTNIARGSDTLLYIIILTVTCRLIIHFDLQLFEPRTCRPNPRAFVIRSSR